MIRWLRVSGKTEVSREDVRRDALCQSVNGGEANLVIFQLAQAGILRLASHDISPRGGRPARR